jgi:geranylgeranyl pyrophosphate synthase
VRAGLEVAQVADGARAPWIGFAEEVGLLFQAVDDLLDGDGYVERLGAEEAERLAREAAERARGHLDQVDADTGVVRDLVDVLAARTG